MKAADFTPPDPEVWALCQGSCGLRPIAKLIPCDNNPPGLCDLCGCETCNCSGCMQEALEELFEPEPEARREPRPLPAYYPRPSKFNPSASLPGWDGMPF